MRLTDEMLQEAENLLAELVRARTVNPPGDEAAAAEVLTDFFRRHNVQCELVEAQERRSNVIARVGDGDRPPLYLLSHLDVVPAGEERWERDPFGAAVTDGEMWGRGTIDTKQITAMHAIAAVLLRRMRTPLRRPVYVLATADEEAGSEHGILHLLRERPGLFQTGGHALTEGGGFMLRLDDHRFYLLDSAQKGNARITVTPSDSTPSGHPGAPGGLDPLASLVRAAASILDTQKRSEPGEMTPTGEAMLRGLAGSSGLDPGGCTRQLFCQLDKDLEDDFTRFLLREAVTTRFSPEYVCAGRRPGAAESADDELIIKVRLLPGVSREKLEKTIRRLLVDVPVRTAISLDSEGHDGGIDGPLYGACRRAIGRLDPEAEVLPFFAVGNTDGRHLQGAGITSYGFAPLPGVSMQEAARRAHGRNERVPLAGFHFGVRATWEITRQLACPGRTELHH